MIFRQYDLTNGKQVITCWIEGDGRAMIGERVILKGQEDELWKIIKVYGQLDSD